MVARRRIPAVTWAAFTRKIVRAWAATHSSAAGSPLSKKDQAAFHRYSSTWMKSMTIVTVTPRLALSDGAAGIEFYKAAFDAKELGERYHMPDGALVHAELLIGDSVVMIKDAQDDEFNALLCTYWPDVDAAWDRAVRAGAELAAQLISSQAERFAGGARRFFFRFVERRGERARTRRVVRCFRHRE